MEGSIMFARVVKFVPKSEKKNEITTAVKKEILPLLKKQPGFLELLPLFPETKNEKMINVTLWTERKNLERYETETFPQVEQILQPYLTSPITWKVYQVETTLCEHFVHALAA
jgi:alpha-amylase/alpha-mannosidase (GH57 family)